MKFLGQIIDHAGVRPDPEKVSAILKLRTPTCVGDIRHLLWMTNELGKFSLNLSNKTNMLCDLLSKNSHWCWDEPQQRVRPTGNQSEPSIGIVRSNHNRLCRRLILWPGSQPATEAGRWRDEASHICFYDSDRTALCGN